MIVVLAVIGAASTVAGPVTAQTNGYSDVADGAFYSVPVSTLAARGVFAGTECDEGFCPEEPVDRKTMAVWIVRVLDGQDPPAVTQTRFNDVDGSGFHARFIERMMELGVTQGCGDGSGYCPDRAVSRAEMAVFLSRGYQLPGGPIPDFDDVPADAWYAADVARLVASGITRGCGDGTSFCPERNTTRGEMATFLHRAETRGEDRDETPTPSYKAMGSGWEHACAVRSDGVVTCWGYGGGGRTSTPDGAFTSVSAGQWHNCGLRPDGTVTCWGYDGEGQAAPPPGEFIEVSAGRRHTCGLRIDGTAVCWGSNRVRKAEAPQGQFRSVAAGGEHSCGVRADGSVTCWGSSGSGQRNVPEGEFLSVTTGQLHSCAIRTDGTVSCWGGAGNSDVPDGRFRSVAAGHSHSCGVRMDNSIICWGSGTEGVNEPPEGDFVAVTAGKGHSCGLRTDETIACWGDTGYDPTDAPGGSHVGVSVGKEHSCGVRTDGTIVCWGRPDRGRTYPPRDAFVAVSAGEAHTCGVRVDETVTCWGGANLTGQVDTPEGRFRAVAAGGLHTCGLRTDGTVSCWGLTTAGRGDVPAGQFSALASGGRHSCGVRTDGAVVCWGDDREGQTAAPSGAFTDVAAGSKHSCGVRQDQAVVCWGNNDDGQASPPSGAFTDVAAGLDHSCGVSTDGTVVCWGANWWGKSNTPAGSFTEVAVGEDHSCGLRTDGGIVCWGIEIIPLPTGAERIVGPGQPDPGACRPYGLPEPTGTTYTAGFPRPADAAPAKGQLRVAVLFVDFPDRKAEVTTRREAEVGLPFAERYLESNSYGRLDVVFEPLHRWLRATRNHDRFARPSPFGSTVTRGIDGEAVSLAEPYVDFSDVDVAMIVLPSAHFSGGSGIGRVSVGDTSTATTRVNTFATSQFDDPGREYAPWGIVAAHELMHNLGLPDLYPYDQSVHARPQAPSGRAWVEAEFGLMGLRAYFLASERSSLLRHTWRRASGQQTTAYDFTPHAQEMLAWSRWQLGWLEPAQIRCITDVQATVSLSPVAEPDDGIAMAVIPLSGSEVIVIESRRQINHDEGIPYTSPNDNAQTVFPALLEEGVFVYTVDASVQSGHLPMAVAGDPGNGQFDTYPVLSVRESITVGGYTITVTGRGRDTHTVTVTKTRQ